MSRPRDAAQGRAGSRTSARTISSAATMPLADLLATVPPGHRDEPWAWEDEERDIRRRLCLCCGLSGHHQETVEALMAAGLVSARPDNAQPVEQLELVPSPPRLSVCRSCRQTIIWTRTERGKKMPLDADPVADHDQAGLFVLRETERRDGPLAIAAWGLNGTEPHYRCHFDTCPDKRRPNSSQVSELAGSTWEDAFGRRNG